MQAEDAERLHSVPEATWPFGFASAAAAAAFRADAFARAALPPPPAAVAGGASGSEGPPRVITFMTAAQGEQVVNKVRSHPHRRSASAPAGRYSMAVIHGAAYSDGSCAVRGDCDAVALLSLESNRTQRQLCSTR